MPGARCDSSAIEEDAKALERKWGAFAEIYAQNRSEAAGVLGNQPGKEHWKMVAEALTREEGR